ncbi:sigma-E processing peptidase SpoIIGA [Clostridium sp.]|uniref:sigma-E processing peptidase SpoIIGA n=1 Tax=Clostridium sp. TaxID=1506 RepID=UPI003F2DCE46
MVVYIDILLIENFIVNLFLLLISMRLLKFNYKRTIYLAAALGALYTLVLFLEIKIASSIPIQIIVAMMMIAMSIEQRKLGNIIKALVTFLISSFTLCGICFSFVIMQNQYSLTNKFSIDNNSMKYVLISLMILYIVIVRIMDYLRERSIIKGLIYDIEICQNNKSYFIKGFLDTGNELREPITNLPCIIVESSYLEEIEIKKDNIFYIAYKTISEDGRLEGFKGDGIRIRPEKGEWKSVEAIICGCNNKLSKENEFNALLSRGII